MSTHAPSRTARLLRAGRRPDVLLLSATLAAAGVGWQQWLHSPHETGAGHHLAVGHWALDAALALPVVLVAVVLTVVAVDELARAGAAGVRTQLMLTGALAGTGASAVLALGGPVHAPLLHGVGAHGEGGVLLHGLREVMVGLPVTLPSALVVLLLLRLRLRRPEVSPRRVLAGLTGTALMSGVLVGLPTAATAAPTPNGPCPAGARDITYDLAAFQNVIPINGWGDRLPDGLQYALRGDDARVGKKQIVADPKLSQPVVIRANVGDCVTVSLRNDIAARRVGLHADGLVQFDPKTSDGARVGNNPDTTAATGQTVSYTWYADRVGEAPVLDIANLDESGPGGSTVQLGLYGAVIVHPTGSTWHDTVTGENLLAGTRAVETDVFADIRSPGEDYRSFAMVFLDENEDIVDRDGKEPTFPSTGLEDPTFGINYRSEPLRNRLRAVLEHRGTKTPENPNGQKKTITLPNGKTYGPEDHFCDGWYQDDSGTWVEPAGGGAAYAQCMGEEMHLQSWIFGDEGTLFSGDRTIVSDNLIPKAYRGDKVRFHIVHPGAKETHPWHQHTQRWVTDPDHPDRTNNADRIRKDVQSISPGEAFPLELEGGAGGPQGTVGDSVFHCHLYPHFAGGMWGHLRVYDTLRDGTQSLPDGTRMQPLQQLPDRGGRTPAPTVEQPGFPLFVEGDVGQRAFRPPHSVIKDDFAHLRRPGDAPRTPTALETAAMPALDASRPGNGVIDPCPSGAPNRTYTPHVTDGKIVYNSAGWHDRQGRVYARDAAEAAAIRGGKNPEPYTIRARIGECVTVQLTNQLHLDEDPKVPLDHVNRLDGVYMSSEETGEASTHTHLVKFDQMASDGTSVGWNYSQAAMPGQTFAVRWFADVALRTVFFHDHQYANLHQQKGLFAAMNVEPADATWHDPKTGAVTDGVGPVADIRSASGPDFREITVFHQDRAPMWKGAGNNTAVQPPPTVDDYGADQGGYAFNYRNEPFQIRTKAGAAGLKADPAYTYSSVVHGDPSTPLFRAYNKDPVIIRNVDGSHEEVHTFNLHGHRWLSEADNVRSTLIDNQTLSLAEYFNYEIEQGRVTRKPTSSGGTLRKASAGDENGVPDILEGGAGEPGDYLYASTPLDDQWLGLWGIFRVPGAKVSDLQPLPDATGTPKSSGSPWPALSPGAKYPNSNPTMVSECPADAPRRAYDITAITMKLTYNKKSGEHDPNGALYVLTADEKGVRNGSKPAEPLTLRANAGDCLAITLRNGLPTTGIPNHTGDVPLPADVPGFPKSNRVSLHPSLVDYDITRSDGAAVGYNHDGTAAPGKAVTYSWYVSPRLDGATINLVDMADRRGHRHHGLFGGLVVEPKDSTWTDPGNGQPVPNGLTANINWVDDQGSAQSYREHTVHWQDGLNLRLANGQPVPVLDDVDDPYDRGNRGINYQTERFAPRLAANPQQAWVFSSQVHGDPATTVMRAYTGERIRLRLLQGSDRGRTHSVVVSGHSWNYLPGDEKSRRVSAEGRLLPTEAHTLELTGGVPGPNGRIGGDFLVRDGNATNQVNAGLWGLLRVFETRQPGLRPL